MLHPGLYEQIINTALNNELAAISAARRRIPISARLAALSTRAAARLTSRGVWTGRFPQSS